MKEQIEAILVRHDPVKLIAIGAPKDEYSSEAHMIWERTSRHFALEKIHDIVYEVFVHQFTGGSCFSMNHGMMEYTGEEAPSYTEAKKIIGLYEDYLVIAREIKELLDQEKTSTT
jgi:hypothetical protein